MNGSITNARDVKVAICSAYEFDTRNQFLDNAISSIRTVTFD
jgi:hypothetical protein